MSDPSQNPLPPALPPNDTQLPQNPETTTPRQSNGKRLLSVVFLAVFIVALAADIYILYLVISMLVFAYSGSNDPTSLNGIGFPIAIIIDVFLGAPAAAITYLAFFGYQKTRRRRAQATSNRLST